MNSKNKALEGIKILTELSKGAKYNTVIANDAAGNSFSNSSRHASNPINSAKPANPIKPADSAGGNFRQPLEQQPLEQQHFEKPLGKQHLGTKPAPLHAETSIDKVKSGLIAKINNLGSGIASVKHSAGSIGHYTEKQHSIIDYAGFIKETNEIIKNSKNSKEALNAFHNIFTAKYGAAYTALGIINGGFIDVRLLDKSSNVYLLKILTSEDDNDIVKAVKTGRIVFSDNSKFLKLPFLETAQAAVIPSFAGGKCASVLAAGGFNLQNCLNLYQSASVSLGLLVQNENLMYSDGQKSYVDTLTNLCSHRRFHEILEQEISDAKKNKTNLSVVIFDINGMGEINKEYGHAAGDEVIRTAAAKINECIKKQDTAARYGGDEFAVILKNMTAEEAKYTAEYITYSISCCQVDKIGCINKISAGAASYPEDAPDKEKLLSLAEQAVLVSKAKGISNGRSSIVSARDYDFWDNNTVNSFAAIVAKRHSLPGVNFEEALAAQFKKGSILPQNHLIEIVTSLAGAIDAKDKYTKDHSSSVSRYSAALAKAVNLSDAEVERIKLGALLHDIGKIGIPEEVLNKPSKLTDEEFNIIKQHPVIAVEKILEPNPALHDLIPIVKHHHEQWNGMGYPSGLKGLEIPLEARIAAIADTFHALISSRPYRKGMSIEKACRILEEGAGVQWDRELVRQFIAIAPSLAAEI